MRVLHVMECTIGGTRRHLVDVARGQRSAGMDVHLAVATRRDPGFGADLTVLEALGVEVTRLEMVREIRPATDVAHLRALGRLLRRLDPDVVHTHSSKAGVLGRRASVTSGVGRRVHTPHTFAFLFSALFPPWKRRLFQSIEERLTRVTDRIVAVSPGEARTFAASGVVPADKVRVVPNGIDAAPFEAAVPLDLRTLGLDPARPTAALVGLVYAAKGQDLALAALADPALVDWQLVCVGPGDAGQLEADARERGLAGRVVFTGARDDVPAVLAATDLLVLPSRWEGMPYVVLEAMAAGKPVVATPVDGARDLVLDGTTGVLAHAIDAAALAEAWARLAALDGAARAALGAAGRARVRASYTIERMVAELGAVYREALECAA